MHKMYTAFHIQINISVNLKIKLPVVCFYKGNSHKLFPKEMLLVRKQSKKKIYSKSTAQATNNLRIIVLD